MTQEAGSLAEAAAPRCLRFFVLTYVLTVGSLAGAAYLWGKVGFDLLVVGLGWPHVLLGLAFNLKRIRRADLKSQLLFLWLLLLSLAIGFGHSLVPVTTLIYLYFVFHSFRDEIFIYHERRTGYRFRGRIFDGSGLALFAAVAALTIIIQLLPHNAVRQLQWYYAQCALAAILSGLALMGRPRRIFSGQPGLRYALPVTFCIITAMTGMKYLRASGLPAPLFFSFLVIFHYFSWYVFSMEKLAARGPAVQNYRGHGFSFSRWVGTRSGFLTAVIAMNVLSFTAAWSYQVLHSSSKLAYAFDMKYFLYFLVLHVTTSFLPRGSVRTPVPAGETFAISDPVIAESSSS